MLQYSSRSFTVIAAIIIFVSCTNTSPQDKNTSDQLISALNEANISINQATAFQMKSLEDKSLDYFTEERATFWFNIAEKVAASTDKLYILINTTSEAKTVEDSLINIYKSTLVYKSDILQTNEQLAKNFESEFNFIRPLFSTIETDSSNKEIPGPFVKSKKSILSFLTTLKSKIKILEYQIVTFCNVHSNSNAFWFEVYNPLISQNSNILSPGSSLEVRAGIGYFSTKVSPEITINNKAIPLLDSGYALYKIKVPEKEGSYHLPVFVKFINIYTGKTEVIKKDIKYTVQKNCD